MLSKETLAVGKERVKMQKAGPGCLSLQGKGREACFRGDSGYWIASLVVRVLG